MKIRKVEGKPLISLENEEALRLCQPGALAETCIWLVMGTEGWECLFFNRDVPNLYDLYGETLEHRWKRGATVAKRNGCPEIEEMRGLAVLIGMGFDVLEAEAFRRGCEKGLQAYREGRYKTLGQVMKELEIE